MRGFGDHPTREGIWVPATQVEAREVDAAEQSFGAIPALTHRGVRRMSPTSLWPASNPWRNLKAIGPVAPELRPKGKRQFQRPEAVCCGLRV